MTKHATEDADFAYRYGMETRAAMYLYDLMDVAEEVELGGIWDAYCLLDKLSAEHNLKYLSQNEKRALAGNEEAIEKEAPWTEAEKREYILAEIHRKPPAGFVPLVDIEGIRSSRPIDSMGEM